MIEQDAGADPVCQVVDVQHGSIWFSGVEIGANLGKSFYGSNNNAHFAFATCVCVPISH